jgi:hypothetical protein
MRKTRPDAGHAGNFQKNGRSSSGISSVKRLPTGFLSRHCGMRDAPAFAAMSQIQNISPSQQSGAGHMGREGRFFAPH